MKKDDLLKLLNRLDIKPLGLNGDWVLVSCPFAGTGHGSKKDDRPSAGFLINDSGHSIFNCFVCGKRSIESVLNTYKWKYGVDVIGEYLRNEISEAKVSVSFPKKEYIKKEPKPVPDSILNKFKPLDNAIRYLTSRGVDAGIARDHGLMYCNKIIPKYGKEWNHAIVVPIKDIDSKTYWLHFRSISGKAFWHAKPEHFGLSEDWGRSDSFFAMDKVDLSKPIIIVEGAFDCLRLKTLGLNNVIATHGGVSKKSEKLLRLKNNIIICGFDSDHAGKEFHKHAEQCFGKSLRALDWNLVGCKDPGELKSREDLEIVLNHSKLNLKFRDKWRYRI